MGYAANGFCFDSADAAAGYACGRDYPVVSTFIDGGGHPASVVIECTGSAGNVLTLQRDVNGLVDGVSTLAITSPVCDETEWLMFHPWSLSADQGAAIGAAVLTVWAVAWGWKAVYLVIRERFSSSSGGGDD